MTATISPKDKTAPKPAALTLLDRDVCLLAFNARVLHWAKRPDVPLLERLRYLCIVSSNLDEFFEVRAALYTSLAKPKAALDAIDAQAQESLSKVAHSLVDEQYALYNDVLMPAFAKEGIRVVGHGERTLAQQRWVRSFFEREVRPLLLPVGLDPSHPFPQVANKSLNFIVQLSGHDAFGRENEIAIVKVPRSLPRFIRMPDKLSGKRTLFVSISSVIRSHLKDLFPGRSVGQFSQFRVTRHSDLSVDEEDVKNLRTALRQGLVHRNYGQAVRLEVSAGCAEALADLLLRQFELPVSALYRVHGPVNLVRLNQEAIQTQLLQRHSPRKQQGCFQVEQNKKNRNQVVAHVKFHARITKGFKATFVRGVFSWVGPVRPKDVANYLWHHTHRDAYQNEKDNWQILIKVHWLSLIQWLV